MTLDGPCGAVPKAPSAGGIFGAVVIGLIALSNIGLSI